MFCFFLFVGGHWSLDIETNAKYLHIFQSIISFMANRKFRRISFYVTVSFELYKRRSSVKDLMAFVTSHWALDRRWSHLPPLWLLIARMEYGNAGLLLPSSAIQWPSCGHPVAIEWRSCHDPADVSVVVKLGRRYGVDMAKTGNAVVNATNEMSSALITQVMLWLMPYAIQSVSGCFGLNVFCFDFVSCHRNIQMIKPEFDVCVCVCVCVCVTPGFSESEQFTDMKLNWLTIADCHRMNKASSSRRDGSIHVTRGRDEWNFIWIPHLLFLWPSTSAASWTLPLFHQPLNQCSINWSILASIDSDAIVLLLDA